ncbi:hypothetical protein GC169_02840 [bacterium]|nr:hypothetical protein [bacterium]
MLKIIRTRVSKPEIASLLQLDIVAEPKHHWEGVLAGGYGSAEKGRVEVKAFLRFQADMIDGEGASHTFPSRLNGAPCTFAVTGRISAFGDVAFEVWFDDQECGRIPFTCTGQIAADWRTISGDWSCACFYGDACGCDGGGGTFELRRVDP